MAGVAGGSLAFETCRAGGLGFIAAGHLHNQQSFEKLEREIKLFRDLSSKSSSSSASFSFPLGIGFIGFSTFGKDSPGWDYFRRILEEHRPNSVQIFAPAVSKDLPSDLAATFNTNVAMCQSYGCQVVAQVGSVKGAIEALEAGVDCLIAQGTEAGGHGIRRDLGNGTLSLTARLVRLAQEQERKIPVLAAGGIADGRGLVAALSLGADGAILGTRLWASKEGLGSSTYKDALVRAESCDDVVRTRVFDTICNSHRATKWPDPFDSSGVLRNDLTDAWDAFIPELEAELKPNEKPKGGNTDTKTLVERFNNAEAEKLPNEGCVYSGQGVGEINSIQPAYDIVQQVETEAIESLSNLTNIVV